MKVGSQLSFWRWTWSWKCIYRAYSASDWQSIWQS